MSIYTGSGWRDGLVGQLRMDTGSKTGDRIRTVGYVLHRWAWWADAGETPEPVLQISASWPKLARGLLVITALTPNCHIVWERLHTNLMDQVRFSDGLFPEMRLAQIKKGNDLKRLQNLMMHL